jgi:hypothetical protein
MGGYDRWHQAAVLVALLDPTPNEISPLTTLQGVQKNWFTRSVPIGLAVAAIFLWSGVARGAEFRYSGQKSKAISLPGLLAGLGNPATNDVYASEGSFDPLGDFISDILGDDFDEYLEMHFGGSSGSSFSIVMVADTGASGILLSAQTRDALSLPMSGETFSDVGIGGVELFDVSQSTRLFVAGSGVGVAESDNLANYSAVGDFKMQVRQEDPVIFDIFPIDINIVGTPVLNQHVMHIQPNLSVEGLLTLIPTIDYLDTELLPSLPAVLPPGRAIRIPLVYHDFIDDPDAPVSHSTNPLVPGVTIVDSRQTSASDPLLAMDWLWDTGATLSVIGRDLAESVIGIDLDNDPFETTAEISGVGGETRILFGYRIDELILPTLTGDKFILEDYIIFVPEEGALPADLPGILGNTAWAQTFGNELLLDFIESPFSHVYVDPFGSQVILIDPNAPALVPEPGSLALAFVSLLLGAGWYSRRRPGR